MELYGYAFSREDDLQHHGILGMKWGVRRFQNEDGSLTAAGKKRYGDDSDGSQRQLSRSEKRAIKKAYRKDQRARNAELTEINKKYDKRNAENAQKTDTVLMKWQQEAINDISKQTQGEFNRDYIKNVASQALKAASEYRSRDFD